MINAMMRKYNYYTMGAIDEYGMPVVNGEPKGTVKMSINIASQSVQDNVLYKSCTYVGLTTNVDIDDTCIIEYGTEWLKVTYVNPMGRYKQVFMVGM